MRALHYQHRAYLPARSGPVAGGLARSAARRLLVLLVLLAPGCSAFPEIRQQPQVHNPFPQLHKVAVLPFYNQSSDPTVNGEKVAAAYYKQLQQIPGFEVMPVGVAKALVAGSGIEPMSPLDFQRLARLMGVDAVIVGSITDFDSYYPPRMGLAVNWYTANPCFHPIPAGYGLPWGTAEEEYIPEALVFQAEFELARQQLKTQAPLPALDAEQAQEPAEHMLVDADGTHVPANPADAPPGSDLHADGAAPPDPGATKSLQPLMPVAAPLPADWPDPRGFIPDPPSAQRPACLPQYEPIITHTALYDGHDMDLTERLADYYYFLDDARFGGWQAYLQRSQDFIDFCCYLHVSETLVARGGAGKSRVVWRWPISRYEP